MNMIVSSVALLAAPASAESFPLSPPLDNFSTTPARLVDLEIKINAAIDRFWECHDAADGADLAFKKWMKRNPSPSPTFDDDVTHGGPLARCAKARGEHTDRMQATMRSLGLGPKKKAREDARGQLREAVEELAAIKATTMDEVVFKAEVAFCRGDMEGVLAKSVAADLLRIQRPGAYLRF